MNRETIIKQVEKDQIWDFVIVGGGATGLGIAVDAASRGFSTILLEQHDFSKSTSSRSTKLVHGGVRYMQQGDIALVREACHERGRLLKNAPHLTKNMSFIIPNYTIFDNILYTVGLTFYDILAGKLSLGRSKYINKTKVKESLPTVKTTKLKGGVLYHDGQFDDSRLAVNLAQTAVEHGAIVVNYCKVTGLQKNNDGKICGVNATDVETNNTFTIKGRSVINATGIYVDDLMIMDAPEKRKMVRPSQGVHLVLDKSFMPANNALMIPKTSDGRVLFAVPWHNKLIVGTTDTLRNDLELEPVATDNEIDFILETAAQYLEKKPTRADVLSVFAGLRPLAAPQAEGKNTKEISRNHKIIVSDSGLVTITGGKWTTYRRMAQDTVDRAIKTANLPNKDCVTKTLKIHGYTTNIDQNNHLYVYGSDKAAILELITSSAEMGEKLVEEYEFTRAEVVWAVRNEFARTVEDYLSRRCRLLLIDARAAIKAVPEVASIMAIELNKDKNWEKQQVDDFILLAKQYILE